jgi:hypothetical protein
MTMIRLARRSLAALIVVAATAANAAGQVCNTPASLIDRVYVTLTDSGLESDQVFAVFRNQAPKLLVRDQARGWWRVDLKPPELNPVPLSSLALDKTTGRGLSIPKTGWLIDQNAEPLAEPELIDGAMRCRAVVSFIAVRGWRVRVVAQQSAVDSHVKVACDRRACADNASTEFISNWMTLSEPFGMKAIFSYDCYVRIELSQHGGGAKLARLDIMRNLKPNDCYTQAHLARLLAVVPDVISLSPSIR